MIWTGVTASAEEPSTSAEENVSAIEALDVVPGLANASVADSGVELMNSVVGVTFTGASGAEIGMSKLGAQSSGATGSFDGQSVVEETSRDTDTVIQGLPDGARIVEVIHSPDAPQDFAYKIDVPSGMTLLPQQDGSILVGVSTRIDDKVQFEVDSVIGAPWATDANGQSVPASYEIGDDGVVTMKVEHSGNVAYPVVADPTVTGGGFSVVYSAWTPWMVTVYLNKARTADAEDAGAAICIGVAFVPVVGPVTAALCGLHNIAIRTTSRYGFCQYWYVNTLTRTFDVRVYRGGFCS